MILFLIGSMMASLCGDVPRAQSLGRYRELWTNSRITVPPPPVDEEKGPGALEDYTLLGVTPLEDGYMVVIKNKKKKEEERIRILPGEQDSKGFKVVEVKQSDSYLDTVVRIAYKDEIGTVGYEEKHLTLKKPAIANNSGGSGGNRSQNNRNANNRNSNNRNTNRNANQGGNRAPDPTQANDNRSNQRNDLNRALQQNATNNTNANSNNGARRPRVRRVPSPPNR